MKPETPELDREIEEAKERLYSLYKKREELREKLSPPSKGWRADDSVKMLAMLEAGETYSAIARTLGFHPTTVRDKAWRWRAKKNRL